MARSKPVSWWRLGVALVLAGQGMVFGLGLNLAEEKPAFGTGTYWAIHGGLALSAAVVVALLGGQLARSLVGALRDGRVTTEALFALSAVGALVASLLATFTGEGAVYYEVVAVVLVIFTLGRLVTARAQGRVVEAATGLRERFDRAARSGEDGSVEDVAVSELRVGVDRVRVRPGEPVTVDGVVEHGRGDVQEQGLTGEPAPVTKLAGSRVRSGSWSIDADLVVRVEAAAGARELDRLLAFVEEAAARPSSHQRRADRITRWFVPVVAGAALATFVGWTLAGHPPMDALVDAMAVLLVACPCALGLATPIGTWSALLGLARLGVHARHGELVDRLAEADLVVFDKTGTLSEGALAVAGFVPAPGWEDRAADLRLAVARAEGGHPHPVARALAAVADGEIGAGRWHPGLGVEAVDLALGGEGRLRVGSAAWVGGEAASLLGALPGVEGAARPVFVTVDDRPAAAILLGEPLRDGAETAIRELAALGVRSVVLTGDPSPAWREIGGAPVEGALSPADKAARVRGWVEDGHAVVVVGDGLNDAGAMAVAPAALALEEAPGLTRAAADAILPGVHLARLPAAVRLCREVRRRLDLNFRIALVYNSVGIAFAMAGLLHPAFATAIMAGSSLTVSTLALRGAGRPGRLGLDPGAGDGTLVG